MYDSYAQVTAEAAGRGRSIRYQVEKRRGSDPKHHRNRGMPIRINLMKVH